MRRLGIVAVGLALVVGTIAIVFAVWASVAEAPWERSESTASPTAPSIDCEEARTAQSDAEAWLIAINGALPSAASAAPDRGLEALQLLQQAREERLLALLVVNQVCP